MMSKSSFLPFVAALASIAMQAAGAAPLFSASAQNLPDLAAPDGMPSPHLAFDRQATTLASHSGDRTWSTQLSYPSRLNAAMNLDYGLRLDPRLAGGARLAYGATHRELLLNAIYAPQPDLQVKLSGSQMRQTDDSELASGRYTDDVAQHNVLLDIRKYWSADALLSDLSATAWHASADGTGGDPMTVPPDADPATPDAGDRRAPATGALQGYLLNIGMAPLPQSRLDLGRGTGQLTYDFADGSAARTDNTQRHLRYTQYLDNCTRLQGSYQDDAFSRSFGLSMASGAWSIGATRTLDRNGGDSSYLLNAAYNIALGKAGRVACASELKNARSFGSMLDSSIARNPNLPAPVHLDPLVPPVPSIVWAKDQSR